MPDSPPPTTCENTMVTTAIPASASPAATASRTARRLPAAARPAAASGTAQAARHAAASPARPDTPGTPASPPPAEASATNEAMPAMTARTAAQAVQLSRRPDHSRTVATLNSKDEATSSCTIVSGPVRSATAWAANPPNSTPIPSSHHGRRTSSRSSRGRPAAWLGVAAAWRCCSAAPVP